MDKTTHITCSECPAKLKLHAVGKRESHYLYCPNPECGKQEGGFLMAVFYYIKEADPDADLQDAIKGVAAKVARKILDGALG